MSDFQLVAYHCPQCGGNVALSQLQENVRCEHCGCTLRIEGKRAPPPAPARRDRDTRPEPFVPAREPTVVTRELGRFEVTLLRQSVREDAREAIVSVPIDDERAGIYLPLGASSEGLGVVTRKT